LSTGNYKFVTHRAELVENILDAGQLFYLDARHLGRNDQYPKSLDGQKIFLPIQ